MGQLTSNIVHPSMGKEACLGHVMTIFADHSRWLLALNTLKTHLKSHQTECTNIAEAFRSPQKRTDSSMIGKLAAALLMRKLILPAVAHYLDISLQKTMLLRLWDVPLPWSMCFH